MDGNQTRQSLFVTIIMLYINYMKIIFALLSIIPFSLWAQKDTAIKSNLSFGITLKNHLPINNFKRTYSYGIGGAIIGELKITQKFSFILNPGYFKYLFNKKITGISGSTDYFLLLGGAKYYPGKKVYVRGESGVGIKTSKFGKESAFAYSGGAGLYVTKNIDVEMEYTKGNGTSFAPENIGLNAAYTFYSNRRTKGTHTLP